MGFLRDALTKIKNGSQYLAKPHIIFYALPWLMVLLILGTVSQKDLGLYNAVQIFINSWILWIGSIPTPGGLTTLSIIFLGLLVKFVFYSPWSWQKAGTILTHLGVLLLLIGGIITAIANKEGFMIIPENAKSQVVSDYKNRIFLIKQEDQTTKEILFDDIEKGDVFTHQNLNIKILEKCNNCGVRSPSGNFVNLEGLAANMELYPIADEKNIEANFSGLILGIKKQYNDTFKTHILMEDIPRRPEINIDGTIISFHLERESTRLPFSLYLKDFRKIDYPGTIKAQGFESDLIIQDGDVEWPVTIRMNEPLRYKGYSFYQSSFDQTDGKEVTVLNVVHNVGRIFPYISTLIIFIGLLLHLIIRLQKRTNKMGTS